MSTPRPGPGIAPRSSSRQGDADVGAWLAFIYAAAMGVGLRGARSISVCGAFDIRRCARLGRISCPSQPAAARIWLSTDARTLGQQVMDEPTQFVMIKLEIDSEGSDALSRFENLRGAPALLFHCQEGGVRVPLVDVIPRTRRLGLAGVMRQKTVVKSLIHRPWEHWLECGSSIHRIPERNLSFKVACTSEALLGCWSGSNTAAHCRRCCAR